MARRTSHRARSRARVVAIATALSLLAPPAVALAEPAAIDEYSLDRVGEEDIGRPDVSVGLEEKSERSAAVDSLGVVGEDVPPQSPLDAAGSALDGTTSLLLAAGAAAAAAATGLARRRAGTA